MELEAKKLVHDLDQAVELIISFVTGKQLADYKGDALESLRNKVEDQKCPTQVGC